MGDEFFKLPQLCCRCRNRDVYGRLKIPERGRFLPNTKYRKAPVWICNACLAKPHRQNRQGLESPPEKKVREAMQVFGEQFFAEHKVGKFIYDFAFPKLKLLMEVDSYTYHHTKARKVRDAKKHKTAEGEGWKLVRVYVGPKIGNRAVQAVRDRRFDLIMNVEPDPEIAKMIYEENYGNGGN